MPFHTKLQNRFGQFTDQTVDFFSGVRQKAETFLSELQQPTTPQQRSTLQQNIRNFDIQSAIPQPVRQLQQRVGQALLNIPTASQLPGKVPPFLTNVLPGRDPLSRGITDFALDIPRSFGRTLTRKKPFEQRTFGEKLEDVGNVAFFLPAGRLFAKAPAFSKEVQLLRNRLTKEDVNVIGKFSELVETGRDKGNLGELGQTIQSLATNVFGKQATTWSNRKIKNTFDLVLQKIGTKPNTAGLGLAVEDIRGTASQLPEGVRNTVAKLTQMIRTAKPLREQQEALFTAERARRSGVVSDIGKRVGGEKGFQAQLGALKGELPKLEFESIRQAFNQTEIDDLFNSIERVDEFMPFEKISAKAALAKILERRGTGLPTRSGIALLERVFPKDVVDALSSKSPAATRLLRNLEELINVPRAIMSSFDLSAPLRQGIFLVGRPRQFVPAFKEMFRYAFSEKAYDDLFKQITARENYPLMREHKLALTDLRSASLTQREEAFMSNMPEKILLIGEGIRASNRAYTGFLNKLRADVFDDLVKSAKNAGVPQNRRFYESLTAFINAATGRGNLPNTFEKMAPVLNATFFSPRLMASRLSLLNPQFYASLEPTVRKEALKSLFSFTSAGIGVLTLAKLGGAEVGADPRSADFGKIKIGNTRFDIWGGFQQYIKLAAQLITGELVSSQTGKLITLGEGYKPLTRADTLARFFENKEAPIPSFITSLLKGQTPTGGKVDVPAEVAELVIPMAIQDMAELWQEGGLSMLGFLPAVFGVGSQTYGRQELVSGENLLGEPTTEVRPVQSIGETIAEKVFGRSALKPSTGASVDSYVAQLDTMPREEAAAIFSQIAQENPDLAKKIVDVKKEQAAGITVEDKALKEKGVASGDRAIAIHKRFMKLKTDEERAALWNELVGKKVITPEVGRQLLVLKEREGEKQQQPGFFGQFIR